MAARNLVFTLPLVIGVLAGATAQAQSAGINVVAPTLPPRQAGGSPSGTNAPAADPGPRATQPTGHPAQQPAHGQTPAHGHTPAYGQPGQPQGAPRGQPSYGASGSIASATPHSALAAGRAPQGGYGYSQPGVSGAEVAGAAIATRSSAAGNCRADLSPDRQTISLMGADALPRQHVPLGEFRAQHVIHSPDGRWAVALTKLRGRPQFAATTLDLVRCEAAHTVDLPGEGSDVRFEGDEAVVKLAHGERGEGGERRVRLASPRVR